MMPKGGTHSRSVTVRSAVGLLALILVVGIVALAPYRAAAQQRAGALPGLGSGQLSEADLTSRDTLVVVWTSWSPRCRDIVDRINALDERWGSQVRVVSVNFQEQRPAIERFLAGQRLEAPVFLDVRGDFAKRHAVTTLPGLLIYRDGEVGYSGKLPNDADTLIGRILG